MKRHINTKRSYIETSYRYDQKQIERHINAESNERNLKRHVNTERTYTLKRHIRI